MVPRTIVSSSNLFGGDEADEPDQKGHDHRAGVIVSRANPERDSEAERSGVPWATTWVPSDRKAAVAR